MAESDDTATTVGAAVRNIVAASAAVNDSLAPPQRRAQDELDQALSESPWYVRVVWYAVRDAWNWLIVAFSALGGTLGLIKDYADANPEKFGFLTTEARHELSIALNILILIFGVMSIIQQNKKPKQ